MTERHKPLGNCFRLPLMPISCGDPGTGEPTDPTGSLQTSPTDPTIRRVDLFIAGALGATGSLRLGSTTIYEFPIAEDTGTPPGTFQPGPSIPGDPVGGFVPSDPIPGDPVGGWTPGEPFNPGDPVGGWTPGDPGTTPRGTFQPSGGVTVPNSPGFGSGMTFTFMFND